LESPANIGTALAKMVGYDCQRRRHCVCDRKAELGGNFERRAYHSNQQYHRRAHFGCLCREQRFLKTRLMSAQAHVRQVLSKLLAIEDQNVARLTARRQSIENDKNITADEVVHKIQAGSAKIEELNIGANFVVGLQPRDSLRTEAIILQQNIAHARH
jgi:hypothetical protein